MSLMCVCTLRFFLRLGFFYLRSMIDLEVLVYEDSVGSCLSGKFFSPS